MAFLNLPNTRPAPGAQTDPGNLTDEAAKYFELYNKVLRSTSGTYSFTSTSSGNTYSTDDFDGIAPHPSDADVYEKGEDGMIAYLKKYVLVNYIMDSTNMTALANSVTALSTTVGNLQTDVGHASSSGVAATGLHLAVETNAADIDTLESSVTTLTASAEKSFTLELDNSVGAWTQVGESDTYYQEVTSQISTHSPVSQYTKVDLQPDASVISAMMDDGIGALLIKNESTSSTTTFKAYSIGAYPQVHLSMQATKTEVAPA